ncbi:hypothetical protein VKT23_015568 [Stygiomarasmius scandens]|uniref:Transposase n=1 Tax=Marasmiellus scandens TaxID=2682957 RepID=A0ABR1J064_9AGAR
MPPRKSATSKPPTGAPSTPSSKQGSGRSRRGRGRGQGQGVARSNVDNNTSQTQQHHQGDPPPDIFYDNGALQTTFRVDTHSSQPQNPTRDNNPFTSDPNQGLNPRHVTFSLPPIPADSPGEQFDFTAVQDAVSSDEDLPSNPVPSTPNRQRNNSAQTPTRNSTATPQFVAHAYRPPSVRRVGTKRITSGRAKDVWTFIRKVPSGFYCTFCDYINSKNPSHPLHFYELTTGTDNFRAHFLRSHSEAWFEYCYQKKVKISSERYQAHFQDYLTARNIPIPESGKLAFNRPPFSISALIDAIIDFAAADDQNSVGKIAITEDMWSDPNLKSYMAVTAHWIERKAESLAGGTCHRLVLKSALIGSIHV